MSTVGLTPFSPPQIPYEQLIPEWGKSLDDLQTAIPELAKDPKRLDELAGTIEQVPTLHRSVLGDARDLFGLEPNSVHLVVTSPPTGHLKSTVILKARWVISKITIFSWTNSIRSGNDVSMPSSPEVVSSASSAMFVYHEGKIMVDILSFHYTHQSKNAAE